MSKDKIHQIYKNKAGESLPGVTTITGMFDKPGLAPAAVKLTKQGFDYKAVWDNLRDIGTLVHRMIMCHIKDNTLVNDDFTSGQIDKAENCFLKYLEWERQHKIDPILVEEPMVSELYGYGGTLDYFGEVDGKLAIVEYKSGKGIYDNYWYQVAAYDQLIKEVSGVSDIHGYRILNIGRDETENFIEEQRTNLAREFNIFLSALNIYKLKKEARRDTNA